MLAPRTPSHNPGVDVPTPGRARGWVAECAACGHEGVGGSECARRRECVHGESVRGVCVCGSWDPLVFLGPVLGPWVCFDDLGVIRHCDLALLYGRRGRP